jgi:hypothetical protein
MKIYTSYYGNARKLNEKNIQIIGISQTFPKFIECPSIQFLAPTKAIRYLPKHLYEKAYINHLEQLDFEHILSLIKLNSNNKDVALCCYESLKTDDDWCHRTMLANYFNEFKTEYDFKIEEFGLTENKFIQLSLI